MGIVSTIPEKCKRCYTCVRECPAKAIRVTSGQAMVIEDRCIACGNCVKVCAQKAKHIEDSTVDVRAMLASGKPVFACLAPSFSAAFHPINPRRVIAAMRQLGFAEVWQVAFGAELVSQEYVNAFERALRSGERIISTPCPAIVSYILKYKPKLADSLAPIVSPMIASGRAIRQRHGTKVHVVFIGPCIAKKNEMRDPSLADAVDAVLTFNELLRMFEEDSINADELPISDFDGPRSYIGRSFPISGGLVKTAGLSNDILECDVLVTEGKEWVISALSELEENNCQAKLCDILFCEGCINGPEIPNDLSIFARKRILADFIRDQNRYITKREFIESLAEFEGLDLSRTFDEEAVELPHPSEEEIQRVLHSMRKFSPDQHLNCGACGYVTCYEKAIAVCQGLAEPDMCLPYVVEELESTCGQLQQSNQELFSAQQRLVQSEKLASMGQISAGVAHEINNPLGTILLYSHMLLKQLGEQDPQREDFEMIANEATRCKTIVRGLLDFARQSRVSKTPTDVAAVVREAVALTAQKAMDDDAIVSATVQDALPAMLLDGDQIKQMLINLISNGIDALEDDSDIRRVTVEVGLNERKTAVTFKVSDSGCGISPENQSKLFTPFFTTKEMGKGTGLGLAITYGVVKMHSGDISVESDEGSGTTFRISIPLETV